MEPEPERRVERRILTKLFAPQPGERPGDLEATLNRIARTARELFAADFSVATGVDSIDGHLLERTVVVDISGEPTTTTTPFLDEEHAQQILAEDILFAEEAGSHVEYASRVSGVPGFSSFASAVLRTPWHGRSLAILYLVFAEPHRFSVGERDLFKELAGNASQRLHTALFAWRYEIVGRIGEEINQGIRPPHLLFENLRKHAGKLVDTQHCLLLAVYQAATRSLDFYSEIDGELITEPGRALVGACKWVIENNREFLIEHLSKQRGQLPVEPADLPQEVDWKPESLLFVPLTFAGECLGVLSVQHPEPGKYDAEDQQILELVANQAGLALNNRQMFEGLQRLNELGQTLTRNFLESEHVVDQVVDMIWEATSCDVPVLFPYLQDTDSFEAPHYRGRVERPEFLEPRRPDDVVILTLRKETPTFARSSRELYSLLRGDPRARQGHFEEREGIESTAALALRVSGEAMGVLFLNFRKPQRFLEPQQQLIGGLANYAAIAIKNARVFGAEGQRYLRYLESFQYIDKELNRTTELGPLLRTILRLANDQVQAEVASILLFNPQRLELRVEAAEGLSAEARLGRVVPLKERGITREAFRTKAPIVVDDVYAPAWKSLFVDTGSGTVAELDVPMLDGEEVLGILSFESPRKAAFKADFKKNVEFLQALAGQAVFAVKRAQAYEAEKRLALERGLLIDLGKELTGRLDRDAVLQLIVRRALEVTKAEKGSLVLVDPQRGDLEIAAEIGNPRPEAGSRHRMNRDDGVIGLVVHDRQTVNIADVTVSPWNEIYRAETLDTVSELAVPLLSGSEVRGVLNVESPLPDHFRDHDERLLEALADFAMVALQNAETYALAERERKRFELLHRAGQQLGEISDLEHIDMAYDIVVHLAERQYDCQVVARRYHQSAHELILVRQARSTTKSLHERISADHGLSGEVFRTGRLIVVLNANLVPPEINIWRADEEDLSVVVAPIQLRDTYYGNLALSHHRENYFEKADIELIDGLCQQLAITIQRLERAKEAQEAHQRALENEAMSWIGRQAYEVAHRLGNDLGLVPRSLRYIRGALEEAQVTHPKVGEHLGMVEDGTRAALALSKTLANRLAERFAGERVAVSAHTLIQGAVDALRLPQSENLFQLSLEISANLGEVSADPEQVTMALLNLLTNAVEAMPQGGHLTVGAMNDGSYVRIWVQDTGRGIEPQNLSRIFNLYYTTKTTGSAGWGLASVRRCVEENGGRVEVTSEPGKGSTFTIFLPRFGTEAP